MWSWVTAAYETAKKVVVKAVDTVKKAGAIVNAVENANVDSIKKKAGFKTDWRAEYNEATDEFVGG